MSLIAFFVHNLVRNQPNTTVVNQAQSTKS